MNRQDRTDPRRKSAEAAEHDARDRTTAPDWWRIKLEAAALRLPPDQAKAEKRAAD